MTLLLFLCALSTPQHAAPRRAAFLIIFSRPDCLLIVKEPLGNQGQISELYLASGAAMPEHTLSGHRISRALTPLGTEMLGSLLT